MGAAIFLWGDNVAFSQMNAHERSMYSNYFINILHMNLANKFKIKSTACIFQTFHLNRFKEFITIVINEGSHKR